MNPYIAWPKSAKVAAVLFMVIAGGFILISAKAILIPVALAVLISFLLQPLVKRLTRWGLHRIASVIVVVGMASILVASIGFVVSSQLKSFADELDTYEANIETKMLAVKSMFKGGTIDRVTELFNKINRRTEKKLNENAGSVEKPLSGDKPTQPQSPQPMAPDAPPEPAPLPSSTAGSSGNPGAVISSAAREVIARSRAEEAAAAAPQDSEEVTVTAEPTSLSIVGSPLIASAIEVMATAGIVILLVTFFLIQQADIRDRIVSVAGRGALATTTKALEEAGARISRYLLMLFVINSTYGIAVAIGLWAMGVPYAIMWGLAAGLIRYVPYIGPWIGACMPIAVSLVTSPGWSQPFMVVALFVVLELVSNNVMEPILYGHSVGLSELGVILSAIIWAWLWGPIGLVLATPMTVCFVVLGRYVPGLKIFDHLLGERAAVSPAVRLYQRLLARDAEDAEDVVEQYLKEHSPVETADGLIIPAIELVRHDLAHDQIDDADADRMNGMLREIVEDVVAESDAEPKSAAGTEERPLVVGVAAHVEEEAILLELLNAVCQDVACRVEVLSSNLLQSERLAAIAERSPELVIVSALPPGDLPYARQLCKRIKASGSAKRLVVARWGHARNADRSPQLLAAGADDVVSSIAELEPMVKTAFHMHQVGRPSGPAASAHSPATAQAG